MCIPQFKEHIDLKHTIVKLIEIGKIFTPIKFYSMEWIVKYIDVCTCEWYAWLCAIGGGGGVMQEFLIEPFIKRNLRDNLY